jgi:hypothetical protein
MALQDDNIAWNRRRMFIAPQDMTGVVADASLGNGVPVLAEISAAFEIVGLQIDADADEVYHFLPIPWDMDIKEPLRFRVWFDHASADADVPVFAVAYKGVGKQASLTDAKSTPDETVTFDAHTCSTTNPSTEITEWAESVSDTKIVSTDFGILLALTCDTMYGSAGEIKVLGLEIDYVVGAAPNNTQRKTRGQPPSGSGPND